MVANGCMTFTVALFLLTIGTYRGMGSKNFKTIKQLLATCGLIESFKCILYLTFHYYNFDPYAYAVFFYPIFYYVQLAVITIGLLKLVHSRIVTRLVVRIVAAVPIVLFIIYTIDYVVHAHGAISYASYLAFNHTSPAFIINEIIEDIIYLEMAVTICSLLIEARLYLRNLVSVYSGADVANGRKLSFFVYGFVFYFLLLILYRVLQNDTYTVFFFIFDMLIFIIGGIVMLNIEDTYCRMMLVDDYMSRARKKESSHMKLLPEEVEKIDFRIKEWEASEDKLYMKEGYTMVEFLSEMQISPLILMNYLENVRKMNFNQWVLAHRAAADAKSNG